MVERASPKLAVRKKICTAVNHLPSRLLAAGHFKRQHHAAAALLLFHQIGLRVIGKPA